MGSYRQRIPDLAHLSQSILVSSTIQWNTKSPQSGNGSKGSGIHFAQKIREAGGLNSNTSHAIPAGVAATLNANNSHVIWSTGFPSIDACHPFILGPCHIRKNHQLLITGLRLWCVSLFSEHQDVEHDNCRFVEGWWRDDARAKSLLLAMASSAGSESGNCRNFFVGLFLHFLCGMGKTRHLPNVPFTFNLPDWSMMYFCIEHIRHFAIPFANIIIYHILVSTLLPDDIRNGFMIIGCAGWVKRLHSNHAPGNINPDLWGFQDQPASD